MNLMADQEGLDPDEELDAEQDKVIDTPFNPASVDIFDRKFTISALLERLKHGELKLTPDFQRRANLWDAERKSRLIESVLLRIPLPSFYFSEDSDGNFEVVDGLQRLCSIFHFVEHAALNKATGAKLNPLRLVGLQYLTELTENGGQSFDELDRPFKRRINELEINVNVIRATTPKAVMFNVFARLNQGGLPLTAQEIRNAIYSEPGVWRDHIRQMAQSDVFTKATGGRIPTERQQDMEMVLRFVALWALGAPYLRQQGQLLDKFLNDSVEKTLSTWDAKKWHDAQQAFYRGLDAALKVFKNHAFRKSYGSQYRSPINKGLFEAQMVTLACLSSDELSTLTMKSDLVSQKFGALISAPAGRFNTALRSGTGHAESSNVRISELTKLIREVLNA